VCGAAKSPGDYHMLPRRAMPSADASEGDEDNDELDLMIQSIQTSRLGVSSHRYNANGYTCNTHTLSLSVSLYLSLSLTHTHTCTRAHISSE